MSKPNEADKRNNENDENTQQQSVVARKLK